MTVLRFNRSALAVTAALGLSLVLAACSSGAPSDSVKPNVQVTSGASSATAAYNLTGVAFDNVGVSEVTYSVDGGAAQPVVLTDGSFSVALNLAPGANDIAVTASDAAGNIGSDSLTVTYNAPPSGAASSVDIAAHGDSVTISGSNFGDSGTVRIGDVVVSTSSWSDSEISMTIPADAPGGPQTVTVESPYGTSTFEMFIGVDFESGTLEELAALGLPRGTAVRLAAGTYSQSTPEVVLDNLSLYGAGVGETIVDSGAAPQILILAADTNQNLVWENLELHSDILLIGPNPPTSVAELETATASLSAMSADPELLLETLGADASLGTLAASSTSVTLRNMLIEENVAGLGVISMNILAQSLYAGSFHLENVIQDGTASGLGLLVAGDVTIEDSKLEGGAQLVLSFAGEVTISSSEFKGNAAGATFLGTSGFLFGEHLSITDTEVTTYSEGFYLSPVSMLTGGGLPIGAGSFDVTDSVFRVLDANPPAATDAGTLLIGSYAGISTFSGNVVVAHRAIDMLINGGNLDFADNTVTMGIDPSIPMAPITVSPAMLASFIDFRGNEVTYADGGGLIFPGLGSHLVHDNTFTAQSGVAVTIAEGSSSVPADLTFTQNTFTGFDAAIAVTLTGVGGDAGDVTFTGNFFDFPIDAVGKVAVLTDVVEVNVDANGNKWGNETDLPTLNSYITRVGATPPTMMEITSVMP